MSEPVGLSSRELLAIFDRCEAYPGIRAAIFAVLKPEEAEASSSDELRAALERIDHAFGAMFVGGQWKATQERIDALNAGQAALSSKPSESTRPWSETYAELAESSE